MTLFGMRMKLGFFKKKAVPIQTSELVCYVLLGHDPSLQGLFAKGSPAHGWPPLLGAGLSHFLFLMLVPGPQVTLHALQALQSPQPPSTIIGREGIVITLNLKCTSLKERLRFGK